jgi:His/Glu/Gln/Arg/opine family amino acid ABC transporter permease subunit
MLHAYLNQLLLGMLVTLKVALLSLFFGLCLGLIGAAGESSKKPAIRFFFISFHTLIRGIPELLVIFLIYFAVDTALHAMHLIDNINSFASAIIALSLLFGAYASQTFRGAFLAIPKGQQEAAQALGLQRRFIWRFILLPQAWRYALPGISNLWLVLLKDTALVSLIGLSDLMMRAQAAAVTTQQPFTFYFAAATIYLLLTSVSEGLMFWFNKRATHYL